MGYQDLLRAATTFSSLALVSENVKFLRQQKKKPKDFIKLGTGNIIGTALIQEQARLIN